MTTAMGMARRLNTVDVLYEYISCSGKYCDRKVIPTTSFVLLIAPGMANMFMFSSFLSSLLFSGYSQLMVRGPIFGQVPIFLLFVHIS